MGKRLLSMMLALAMLFSLLQVAALANGDADVSGLPEFVSWADMGADTEFKISSEASLRALGTAINVDADGAQNMSGITFYLANDIELISAWTPIKGVYASDHFAGTFDGQNYTISGLSVDQTGTNQGLFGATSTGATIRNLNVEGSLNCGTSNYIGGIVGYARATTIQNCSFSGSVKGGYTGGIVGGFNGADSVIEGCVNKATVEGTVAGGILGYASGAGAITNCYNAGIVKGSGHLGGIAGQANPSASVIRNCYNIGKILPSGSNNAGGIYGFSGGTISNCYYLYPETQVLGGAGNGAAAEKITSAADLSAVMLSDAFATDINNVNGGYPVLLWQGAPDLTPSIGISGGTTLHMTNTETQPITTLTASLKNIPDNIVTGIEWGIEKKDGGSASAVAILQTPLSGNKSVVVEPVGGGTVTVTVTITTENDEYIETRDVSVIPYITAAEIVNVRKPGAVAIGQTVTAKVFVLGGTEYDYGNYPPLTYQWKYRPSSGITSNINGATDKNFTISEEYNEWDYLHLEVSCGGSIVVDGMDTYASIRSEDYGKLYPAAYDKDFTLPSDKKDTIALSLPSVHTANDVTANITWTSDNTGIIANDGTVTMPLGGKVTVTLSARFEYGSAYANQSFTVTVWSQAAIDEEVENQNSNQMYLQTAAGSLGNWYGITPIYGTDTNVAAILTSDLLAKGYADISVTVKNATEVYGNCGIAPNGDITYFYADPGDMRGVWFGRYDISFTLKKGDASFDMEAVPATIYWDAGKVKTVMENEILSGVDETAILGANTDKNNVISNLTLPRAVDGKKWTQVVWTSSDSSLIFISDENQGTADTLLDPYVGRVARGEEDKTVTLTAAFTFRRTTGSELPIVMYKVFTVTVKALSGAEADAVRAELEKKLEAGFASAGLRDYVTGEKLIETGGEYIAANDIRLPTTRDFGVDGKYYPVTITCSDENVIATPDVANSARVMVYRPLVGSPAKIVTLTVAITDVKKGLSASKSFQISVQPLTQKEIDDALSLMDLAKSGYFNGLSCGRYEDEYSVTGSLHSFREAVWNGSQDDVTWIYNAQSMTRSGIIADELENWADQEAWRAFRSSDPKILEHETLNLLAKPGEDTFVRINSALTHEVFGKYWEKFDTDPAYATFAQLYKQPVSAYVMVEGKNHLIRTPEQLETMRAEAVAKISAPITSVFTLFGARPEQKQPLVQVTASRSNSFEEILIYTTVSGFDAGSTVFEVFRKVLSKAGYTYTANGSYVKTITDPNGNTLSEKDGGPNSGWIYTVNGVMPSVYMNGFSLEEGDEVAVWFTQDYTKEEGFRDNNHEAPGAGGNSSSGGPATVTSGGGTVSIDYIQSGASITLTLPEGKIKEIIRKSVGTATIDLSGIKNATSVTLPSAALGKLADEGLAAALKLPQGTITLDADAASSTAAQAGGNITFSLCEASRSTLTPAQQDAIGKADTVIDVTIKSGSTVISNFNGTITVTVPYTGAQPVAVWYLSNEGVMEKLQCVYDRREGTVTFLTGHLSLYVIGQEPTWQNTFADVAESAWYYGDIKYVYLNGLMSGTNKDPMLFSPNMPLTRGMIVTILYRHEGSPNAGDAALDVPFSDAEEGKYYLDALRWAAFEGIVTGYDGKFNPEANITRQDLAVILWKYAQYADMDVSVGESTGISAYNDAPDTSEYAIPAMRWACGAGIITGKPGDLLAPHGTATRAEAAAMLHRFLELTAK